MRSLFLIGVGVIVGMLIAPEKGSVLRAKLTGIIDDLEEAKNHFTQPTLDEDGPVKMNA